MKRRRLDINRNELRKLKDGKVTEGDGIPNEVWRGGSRELVVGGL